MASEHETAQDYEDALRKHREAERRDDREESVPSPDPHTPDAGETDAGPGRCK